MNATGAKLDRLRRASTVAVALSLLFLAAQRTVSATDKAPKGYPEKGKVVAASMSEHTNYVPVSPADSKGRTSGGEAFVHRNWVYRVETDDGSYEFEGGKKQSMTAGDAVEFRIVKDNGYVRAGHKEMKYRILSSSSKPTK